MFQIRDKRGIEITFNWIFALVAGGIIFLFFIGFAAENMDLFGKLTAMRVSEELNSAFSGLKTTLVSTEIGFDKEIELKFECIRDKDDNVWERLIVGYRGGRELYDNIIFSPEEMEGDGFLLMTKAWKVPYRVDNFIFISDKDRRYYLDDSVPDGLVDNLPKSFQGLIKRGISSSEKTIAFNEGTICGVTGDKNKIQVAYSYDGDNLYGTICGEDWERAFYGDAMIYAAIFGDQFNCLYPLLDEKFQIMREVYLNKVDNIKNCDVNTGGIRSYIENMDGINKIQTYLDNIKKLNGKLIGAGCGAVF